jgi:hypothetical protein
MFDWECHLLASFDDGEFAVLFDDANLAEIVVAIVAQLRGVGGGGCGGGGRLGVVADVGFFRLSAGGEGLPGAYSRGLPADRRCDREGRSDGKKSPDRDFACDPRHPAFRNSDRDH